MIVNFFFYFCFASSSSFVDDEKPLAERERVAPQQMRDVRLRIPPSTPSGLDLCFFSLCLKR